MDYIQRMKDMPENVLYSRNDKTDILSTYQRECLRRFNKSYQMEQEGYLVKHPEIKAMIAIQFARTIESGPRNINLKIAAKQLTRSYAELDKEIRALLHKPPDKPYYSGPASPDETLITDLLDIHSKFYPLLLLGDNMSDDLSSKPTKSSSFQSIVTSRSTLATPEPSPVPSPTESEIFYGVISKIVDKATLLHIQPYDVLYDAAYVAIMNAVENAMEITVKDIKADIIEALEVAYDMFNTIIGERARLIAERNWERRMRKKLKRTLRREENFKGYKTPTTPKSELSSHESYKKPPPRPCKCHAQYNYNRYPKDRFGIYLPRDKYFSSENITSTPILPEDEEEEGGPS